MSDNVETVETGERALLLLVRVSPLGGRPEASRLLTIQGHGEEFRRRAHDALDLALAGTEDDLEPLLALMVDRAEGRA